MLMAVEMWVKRDHKAEWRQWSSWLDTIAAQVSKVDGVTTALTARWTAARHADQRG
jgi:L-seryl-tRNA(Ser) seleniumtransferase